MDLTAGVTQPQVRKLVINKGKEKLLALDVKHIKTNLSESLINVKCNDINFLLYNYVEKDLCRSLIDNKLVYDLWPKLTIKIEGIKTYSPNIFLPHFYQEGEHKSLKKLGLSNPVETMRELDLIIDDWLYMFMYFYKNVHDTESLYHFLLTNRYDKHFKRVYRNGRLFHICPQFLYELAYMTKQPNLPELRKQLRDDYVEHYMHEYNIQKQDFDEKEEQILQEVIKENRSYEKLVFQGYENPEQTFAQQFDDFIETYYPI